MSGIVDGIDIFFFDAGIFLGVERGIDQSVVNDLGAGLGAVGADGQSGHFSVWREERVTVSGGEVCGGVLVCLCEGERVLG